MPSEANDDDVSASFEQALANQDKHQYRLRLYIAGTTPRSMLAIQSLKSLCETYLQGRYELEVIDIYQASEQIKSDNIVAIPTLIKQLPLPLRRVIGDLSNTEKVLLGLDILPK
ncbi:MAG TPA: circadian clock KaiB family protein [Leptolyngbyaceae cyanobacterium]